MKLLLSFALSFFSAACIISSRAASIFVAICASFSWIAWWCAIGFPNASRSWA